MLTLEFSVYGLLFDFQCKTLPFHTSVYTRGRRPGRQKFSAYTHFLGKRACCPSGAIARHHTLIGGQAARPSPRAHCILGVGGQAARPSPRACCHYWVAASPPGQVPGQARPSPRPRHQARPSPRPSPRPPGQVPGPLFTNMPARTQTHTDTHRHICLQTLL